jgi:hypothetical protein
VDDLILKQNRDEFPKDAVPFIYDAPSSDRNLHVQAIDSFKENIVKLQNQQPRFYEPRKAVIVVSDDVKQIAAADCVRGILDEETYNPKCIIGKDLRKAYEDVRLLETLLDSELCVFLFGGKLSWVHVMLAMAHAHSVPCIRLRYNPRVKESQPDIYGLIPWGHTSGLTEVFRRQLESFRRGYVEPLKVSSDHKEAAQTIAKMQWKAPIEQYWDTLDGRAILNHLQPNYSFVQDEVSRARQSLGGSSLALNQSRSRSTEVCRCLYDGFKRHNYSYEVEPQLREKGRQVIRTPNDIETHECATCIDLACLFSSLLWAAYLHPVIVVVDGPGFAHALVGYRASAEPALKETAGLGDLRGALMRKDIVLFEPTGAVQSSEPVSIETEQERKDDNNMLHFKTAKDVAIRLLNRKDIEIRYVFDLDTARN